MSKIIIYKCDRCGKSGDELRVYQIQVITAQAGYSNQNVCSVDYCHECMKKYFRYPREKAEEAVMIQAEQLEEIIRCIAREEVQDNG